MKNMYQVIEQTKGEKMSMYMKMSKRSLAEMLINCNDIITTLMQEKNRVTPNVSGVYCGCRGSECYLMNGSYICATCNRPLGK